MDSTVLTQIQTGVGGADASYFAIGGSILVVLAGIWGFRLIKGLIDTEPKYSNKYDSNDPHGIG